MKTMHAIQTELKKELPAIRMTNELLLHCSALVGELFEAATPQQRQKTAGYLGITLARYCASEKIDIPHGPYRWSKENLQSEMDSLAGVVSYTGKLARFHSKEYKRQIQSSESAVEIVAHIVYYLDEFLHETSPKTNLLVETNMVWDCIQKS